MVFSDSLFILRRVILRGHLISSLSFPQIKIIHLTHPSSQSIAWLELKKQVKPSECNTWLLGQPPLNLTDFLFPTLKLTSTPPILHLGSTQLSSGLHDMMKGVPKLGRMTAPVFLSSCHRDSRQPSPWSLVIVRGYVFQEQDLTEHGALSLPAAGGSLFSLEGLWKDK